MKYLILLLLIACTLQTTQTQETTKEQTMNMQLPQDITIEHAKTMQDAVILDIRTPQEFNQGHLENAINIDYYADDFEDKIAALDPNQTYLVHCKSGGRSAKAMPLFSNLKAHNMLGGYDAWKKAEYPITLS